jgi:hypothetical protein
MPPSTGNLLLIAILSIDFTLLVNDAQPLVEPGQLAANKSFSSAVGDQDVHPVTPEAREPF